MKTLLLLLSGNLLRFQAEMNIEGRGKFLLSFFNKENRDLAKRIIAIHKQQFLPSMAYVRDDLSPQQLQLDNRLKDKCTMWNMQVGWKLFVVTDLEKTDKQAVPLNKIFPLPAVLIRLKSLPLMLVDGIPSFDELKNETYTLSNAVSCITETWLDDTIKKNEIYSQSFTLFRNDRVLYDKISSGGIFVAVPNLFDASIVGMPTCFKRFAGLTVRITFDEFTLYLLTVYRPLNLLSERRFYSDFKKYC